MQGPGTVLEFGSVPSTNSRMITLMKFIYFSPTTSVVSGSGAGTQELHQLAQYLQEAIFREQQMENKLTMLQKIVAKTKYSTDNSWKVCDKHCFFTGLSRASTMLYFLLCIYIPITARSFLYRH